MVNLSQKHEFVFEQVQSTGAVTLRATASVLYHPLVREG